MEYNGANLFYFQIIFFGNILNVALINIYNSRKTLLCILREMIFTYISRGNVDSFYLFLLLKYIIMNKLHYKENKLCLLKDGIFTKLFHLKFSSNSRHLVNIIEL